MNQTSGAQYCGACGTGNPVAARFCQRCGAPLGAGSQPLYPQAANQPAYGQGNAVAPTQQQWVARQRAQVAATRSYTTPAVITLVLYWVFWLPGFVVNLVYLSQARGDRAATGVDPEGLGCLWALLWVFVLVPILLLVLALGGAITIFGIGSH